MTGDFPQVAGGGATTAEAFGDWLAGHGSELDTEDFIQTESGYQYEKDGRIVATFTVDRLVTGFVVSGYEMCFEDHALFGENV